MAEQDHLLPQRNRERIWLSWNLHNFKVLFWYGLYSGVIGGGIIGLEMIIVFPDKFPRLSWLILFPGSIIFGIIFYGLAFFTATFVAGVVGSGIDVCTRIQSACIWGAVFGGMVAALLLKFQIKGPTLPVILLFLAVCIQKDKRYLSAVLAGAVVNSLFFTSLHYDSKERLRNFDNFIQQFKMNCFLLSVGMLVDIVLAKVFGLQWREFAELTELLRFQASYDDPGDLQTPVDQLQGFLNTVADVSLETAVFGPGYCLIDAVPSHVGMDRAVVEAEIKIYKTDCSLRSITGVSLDQAAAIAMYTAHTPYRFYEYINYPLIQQNRTAAVVQNQAPIMRILLKALRNMFDSGEIFEGTAYRALRVSPRTPWLWEKLQTFNVEFAIGRYLTFAPLSSLTTKFEVAREFMFPRNNTNQDGSRPLLFVFNNITAVRLQRFSRFPAEEEVMLEPPSMFQVARADFIDGYYRVTLDWIAPSVRYLNDEIV